MTSCPATRGEIVVDFGEEKPKAPAALRKRAQSIRAEAELKQAAGDQEARGRCAQGLRAGDRGRRGGKEARQAGRAGKGRKSRKTRNGRRA
ncbi:MAG: hypothetical protein ACLUI3_05350 [Christensenellales bacterium]